MKTYPILKFLNIMPLLSLSSDTAYSILLKIVIFLKGGSGQVFINGTMPILRWLALLVSIIYTVALIISELLKLKNEWKSKH